MIDKIAQDLYDGKIKASDLNQDLITKTYNDLSEGAEKGVGKSWTTLYKKDGEDSLVTELKKNLYTFASAKNYAQLETFNKMLYYQDGTLRPFNEYSQLVKKSNAQYNKHWLQAEYQTAITAGQMAMKWQRIQRDKDLFPNLKYRTVGDERVREEHAALNGIIKPVDDPFWGSHYPPNGWRCRCDVVQTAENATTTKITTQPNPVFEGNVARDEVIFSKKHQFFKILNTNENAKKNVELVKLNAPYELKYESKGGAKVSKSIFADKSDQEGNVQSLITIADNLNISSNINPHTFINGRKNPEINIKGINGDRVHPTSKNIKSGITNAFNDKLKKGMQLREEKETFIILDLSIYKNLPNIIDDAISQSWSKFTHYKNIKSLYVEFNQNAILIKKTDKMKYEDFSNDFKKVIKAKSKV